MTLRTHAFSGIDHGLVSTVRDYNNGKHTDVECKITFAVENPVDGFPHRFEIFVRNGTAARLLLNAAFRNGNNGFVPVELERCLHSTYENKPAVMKPSYEIVSFSVYRAMDGMDNERVRPPASVLARIVGYRKHESIGNSILQNELRDEIHEHSVLIEIECPDMIQIASTCWGEDLNNISELENQCRLIDAWHVVSIRSPDDCRKLVNLQSLTRDDRRKQISLSRNLSNWKIVEEGEQIPRGYYRDIYVVPDLRVKLPELKNFHFPPPAPSPATAPVSAPNPTREQIEHENKKKKRQVSEDEDAKMHDAINHPPKKKKQRNVARVYSDDTSEDDEKRPMSRLPSSKPYASKKNKPTTKRAIKRHWGTTSSDETDDEACQLKTRINKSERKKKEDDEDKYTASKKSKKPKKVKEEDYSDDTV